MLSRTLLDLFSGFAQSRAPFLVWEEAGRSRACRYDQVAGAAAAFGQRLHGAGIHKGDKVVFWGENRVEWVVAFWGCLLTGVIVVPIDYHSSADFLRLVLRMVRPRLILAGARVSVPTLEDGIPVWRFASVEWASAPLVTCDRIGPDDVVEILFTSGSTAEPKGVILTHRNFLADLDFIEREVRKYRSYFRPLFPLRFLNLLPLSHAFGQALALFVPPMLPGFMPCSSWNRAHTEKR